MANEITRKKLLEFLSEKHELNGGSGIELNEFYSLHKLSEKQVMPTLSHFTQCKIIQLSLDHKTAWLTPEGYKIAKPDDVSVRKTGNISVSFNSSVTGSAVAIGNSTASINNNYNTVSAEELASVFEKLKNEIYSMGLPPDELTEKIIIVEKIISLAESENPDKKLINILLNNALPITANVAALAASISSLLG